MEQYLKIYKEAKLSKFYGDERIEDLVFREYLLSIDISTRYDTKIPFTIPDELPKNFIYLLENDLYIQRLWNNEGKSELTDTSRTGYDYSLIIACIERGITDIKYLFAILVLRPEGAFMKSGKNEQYIRRTIANAIFK